MGPEQNRRRERQSFIAIAQDKAVGTDLGRFEVTARERCRRPQGIGLGKQDGARVGLLRAA